MVHADEGGGLEDSLTQFLEAVNQVFTMVHCNDLFLGLERKRSTS